MTPPSEGAGKAISFPWPIHATAMLPEPLITTALPSVLLGGFHGLNPAMGWLFAVFLALQHRSRQALLMALLPIAAGHAASVAAIALIILLSWRHARHCR
jgi:hypothetical protein